MKNKLFPVTNQKVSDLCCALVNLFTYDTAINFIEIRDKNNLTEEQKIKAMLNLAYYAAIENDEDDFYDDVPYQD